MNALDKQVGGQHYKSSYQPIQLICKMRMNFIQGNILKYPSRFIDKNGQEDLHKAIHYAQLGAELTPKNVAEFNRVEAIRYVKENALPDDFVEFIEGICKQDWTYLISYINHLDYLAYSNK